MPNADPYEIGVLAVYEKGELKSVASKDELAKLKSDARATAIKDKRVNIRLSSAKVQCRLKKGPGSISGSGVLG